MARNKHPEQTVQKILEISHRLFLEKGYDHTTIQDIVNELGMSKGAVYHHFKSKEDILDHIGTQYYDTVHWFQHIRQDEHLTGLEKIRHMLMQQFSDSRKMELDQMVFYASSLRQNPRLIAASLDSTMTSASDFLEPLILEGMQDGSIPSTSSPRDLAEVFSLLMNVWIGIYAEDAEDLIRCSQYIKKLLDSDGFPLLDEELMAAVTVYAKTVFPQESHGT